jgi:Flp pilus assembly protein TadD
VPFSPASAGAAFDGANWYANRGELARAEALCREALELAPYDVQAMVTLATLLAKRGQHRPAEDLRARACARAPGFAQLHAWRGRIASLTDPETAEQAARDALALDPSSAGAQWIVAFTAIARGDAEEALEGFRRASELDPGYVDVRIAPAATLMYLGRHGDGFAEFARVLHPEGPIRWNPGESITGRTIVLADTNGIGDAVLFSGWVPALAAQGARVIIATPQAGLARLLGRLAGIDRVITHWNPTMFVEPLGHGAPARCRRPGAAHRPPVSERRPRRRHAVAGSATRRWLPPGWARLGQRRGVAATSVQPFDGARAARSARPGAGRALLLAPTRPAGRRARHAPFRDHRPGAALPRSRRDGSGDAGVGPCHYRGHGAWQPGRCYRGSQFKPRQSCGALAHSR